MRGNICRSCESAWAGSDARDGRRSRAAAVTVEGAARLLADIRIDPADLPRAPFSSGREDTVWRVERESHTCRVCRRPATRPVVLQLTDAGERWLDLCEECWPIARRYLYHPEDPTRLLTRIRSDPSTLPAAPPDANGEDIALRAEYEDHHPCRGCGRSGGGCPVILCLPDAGNRWLDLCDDCRPLIQQVLDNPTSSD